MKRSISLVAAALVALVAPVALRAQAGTRPTFDQVTVAGAFGGLSGAAHLDPASARHIGEAVETVLSDRTVVLVSHGRGWTGETGRIIRLDQGKLLLPSLREKPSGRSPAAIR